MAGDGKPAVPRPRLQWRAPVGFCYLALVALATCLSMATSFTIPRPAHRSWLPRTCRQRSATIIMGERSTLLVVGGGAAGYFGAIQAAASTESGSLRVVVLEAGRLPLSKVKISGGGRCNVMHDIAKPVSLIAQGYPRGSKQLIGPFKSLFGPADAAEWFQSRGVALKTEGDGRMFPVTDDSQTIIDCLEGAARDSGVEVITSARVTSIVRGETANEYSNSNDLSDGLTGIDDVRSPTAKPSFKLTFTAATQLSRKVRETLGDVLVVPPNEEEADGNQASPQERVTYRVACDYVLQATGASREGHAWAASLGHDVSPPVPSLFTFTINDPRVKDLSGVSVQDAEVKLVTAEPNAPGENSVEESGGNNIANKGVIGGQEEGTANKTKRKKKTKAKQATTRQRGPLLITHTGVSGPAVLKLSAFGARELSNAGYKAKLVVNWVAGSNPSKALDELQAFRKRNPKKTVYAFCPISGDGGSGATRWKSHSEYTENPRPEESPPPPTIPRRLWQSLAQAASVGSGDKWADVSNAKLSALAKELTACELRVIGKGSFKEEFVTCGGVSLSAVDMRTMESRTIPGLYFAGEVVDVDGMTGGYNFQSAWTTGWVAGTAIGARVREANSSDTESRGRGEALTSSSDEGGHGGLVDIGRAGDGLDR